ncbi:MAG: mitofilin family membrane protein, partial [Rhodospirillales bacterium]
MAEDAKKDAKSEGSADKPNEGGADKPGPQAGGGLPEPPPGTPGEAGKEAAKPAAARSAAGEPGKQPKTSVPPAGAGTKPEPSSPAGGTAAKPAEGRRPPAAPPKKTRRGGCLTAILWLIAVSAAVVAGGYFTWPWWSPAIEAYLPKTTADDARVADLEARLGDVERQLAAPRPEIEAIRSLQAARQQTNERLDSALNEVQSLRQAIASLGKMAELVKGVEDGDAGQALAALGVKIDELEGALARLGERSGRMVADLERRIDAVEAQVVAVDEGTSGAAAAALATGQLAQALKGSGPFAAELNAVRWLAKDDPEMAAAIAALEPRASAGVPTVAELRARFPAVADAANRAAIASPGEDWLDRAVNRLSGLVSVRRIGDSAIAGGGVDGALAGAEKALAAGDLAAAIRALDPLPPPAAAAAAGWLDDARTR